tara:strand:- start:1518 stop:2303 length:786 start_codon:yes stop_codon:yes gene_type:complete
MVFEMITMKEIEIKVSQLAHWFAQIESQIIAFPLIWMFAKAYGVNTEESGPLSQFRSLKEFFTRKIDLKKHRNQPSENHIVSPCDGTLSAFGHVDLSKKQALEIKGSQFSPAQLVGKDFLELIDKSNFFVFYLAPGDYHCFHTPFKNLRWVEKRIIPGRFFSVRPQKGGVSNKLSENERVICQFQTESNDTIIMVLIGAMIVRSIELMDFDPNKPMELGALLGQFNFGSSIVVFSPSNATRGFGDLQVGRVKTFDPIMEVS